jgi:putative phosphoribosyl transferase
VRRFRDRVEAGRELAQRLAPYAGRDDVTVLALPRGGLPVGREVADALGAPLDVLIVRKLGVPGQEELAMGALASGGARVLNQELVDQARIPPAVIDRVVEREQGELDRREERYRGGRPPADVRGRTVILVDDGVATGSTMQAAVLALRSQEPARVVAAVPTAPPQTCRVLERVADEVVCLMQPQPFYAVGFSYEDFSELDDDEVRQLLEPATEQTVAFSAGDVELEGNLVVPADATGVVVFAHGSGSSRFSPRNRRVAAELERRSIGTLLIDLLSSEEEERDARTAELRFDIELLSARLLAAIEWVVEDARTSALALGCFGASTGAGAALVAAARRPEAVRAVVSRGGRPDLAGAALQDVRAPTLLVVGEHDELVLDLNRRALALMEGAEAELEVVPGATHLFEEAGALERVAELAGDWFTRYLG